MSLNVARQVLNVARQVPFIRVLVPAAPLSEAELERRAEEAAMEAQIDAEIKEALVAAALEPRSEAEAEARLLEARGAVAAAEWALLAAKAEAKATGMGWASVAEARALLNQAEESEAEAKADVAAFLTGTPVAELPVSSAAAQMILPEAWGPDERRDGTRLPDFQQHDRRSTPPALCAEPLRHGYVTARTMCTLANHRPLAVAPVVPTRPLPAQRPVLSSMPAQGIVRPLFAAVRRL